MKKNNIVRVLEQRLEKLTNKKVAYENKIQCSCQKSKLTEDVEKETVIINTNKPILGNIIPAPIIKEIEEYVNNALIEIDELIERLKIIKNQATPQGMASSEDFSTLTERISFLTKQLSRISLFINNTIKAEKFDKNILNKIFNQKES